MTCISIQYSEYADVYVVQFLQFWIYVLGVPAVAALVVINEVLGKFTEIIGVIVS